MLTHLRSIIAEFSVVPKRLELIVTQYLMFLLLDNKKHELRTASRIFGIHESNYSRMLSKKSMRPVSRQCLNRAISRRLDQTKETDEVYLIVDATFTGRSGKKVKNRKKFRHGAKFFEGHQFTNFVLLVNDEVIPLASIPFYSKEYCKEIKVNYQTEIAAVTSWIEMLPTSGLLPARILEKLHFILDTGYDAKPIQKMIRNIGGFFTVGLSCERSVNSLGVRDYFRRICKVPWKTIRLKIGNGYGEKKERMFRVRSLKKAYLKGFGDVNVICSEKKSRTARKKSQKFIATNNLKQSARKTVSIYAKRWAIETWHKEMKQKFGYGDCRSRAFTAIETHINFALCAYCIAGLKEKLLPKSETTLDQYQTCQDWKHAAKVINMFDGRKKIKTLAHQEVAKVMNG